MAKQSYPVFVEYTQTHIVWVESDTPEQAADYLSGWPYDSTKDDVTLWQSGLSVRAPKNDWEWQDVYDGGDYGSPYTTECDAHVEWHKHTMFLQKQAAERVACTEAGHPETDAPIWDGRIWCKRCKLYLDPPAQAVSR